MSGTAIKGVGFNAAISGAGGEIRGPNPKRRGLLISSDPAFDAYLNFGEASAQFKFIYIPKLSQALYLDRSMIGERITEQIQAMTTGPGMTICIWETFDP